MASATSTPGSEWIFACVASSITNIEPDFTRTSSAGEKRNISLLSSISEETLPAPCKILSLASSTPSNPDPNSTTTTTTSPHLHLLTPLSPSSAQASIGLSPQLLIFRYRSKIHAIDHACPHQSYPLSRGELYDIEDFGILLSAGIGCPKHGWTFDLFTGESDRGGYRLGVWDVELRKGEGEGGVEGREAKGEEEVWVRRREKRGPRGMVMG